MDITPAALRSALGRPVEDTGPNEALLGLSGRRVLITGASGSIGQALASVLRPHCDVLETDETDMDVTSYGAVEWTFLNYRPEVVFHLAGAKHAPMGEEHPWHALEVNAIGTDVVLEHAPEGCRVVLASTCKACNPETAYGASKLIAERLALNAGQSVARFYNVVETQGNVFDIWSRIPSHRPLPWTGCWRFFMSIEEAIGLLLWSALLPPARYTFAPSTWRWTRRFMGTVAREMYPGREYAKVPPRRGDRLVEPRAGDHEEILPVDGHPALGRVVSPHD
jgi:FlaA1/EpsC-like NDP-sugar epimerase